MFFFFTGHWAHDQAGNRAVHAFEVRNTAHKGRPTHEVRLLRFDLVSLKPCLHAVVFKIEYFVRNTLIQALIMFLYVRLPMPKGHGHASIAAAKRPLV